MSIQRISFNINGSNFPNKTYFMDFLKRLEPTTILIMDSYDLAISLAASLPNTKIVHRSYSDDDAQFWNPDKQPKGNIAYQAPEVVVAREIAWGHPEIARQVLNEPPVGDPRLITWLVKVAELFLKEGYKAVLGNFAVGNYSPEQVDSGYLDPIIELSCKEEDIWFGDHHYTGIILAMGVGQWSIEQLYDKSRVQPQSWPTMEQLPVRRWWNAETQRWDMPPYWNMRRSDWITIRAQEKGFGIPKFWITETGWDALPNLGNLGVYDHFRNQYGIPAPHNSLRGVTTLFPIWRDYFPQWSPERAAFEQLRWLNSIYPENYVGFNLFTVNGNDDWKRDSGCDFSELYELHNLLLAEKQSTPIPVPPVDVPFPDGEFKNEYFLAPVGEFFHVREFPRVTAATVETVHGEILCMIAEHEAVTDGEYQWFPILNLEIKGWFRSDVATFVPYKENPMPDPTPNPTPAPAPTSSILAWVMVNGVILIILFALFLVMRSSTALASQDVSTLPISLEQAASMILATIVAIVMGAAQVPVVTPLVNLVKWGLSWTGLNVSADHILLAVSTLVTIAIWIAGRLGLGFQLDSVFSVLVTVLPLLTQLLNSIFGSKALYADAVRSQVSAFGYQRTA